MFQDIVTDRLILRDLEPADAEIVFRYRSDPQVSRYQSWEPASAEMLRLYIEELAGKDPDTPGAWYQLGIATRSGGESIGDCGIHILDDPRLAEIGIAVAPRFQCRGYATEALRAVSATCSASFESIASPLRSMRAILARFDSCNAWASARKLT
jgi:RimJ/RimL family protein N-acetyltransferase